MIIFRLAWAHRSVLNRMFVGSFPGIYVIAAKALACNMPERGPLSPVVRASAPPSHVGSFSGIYVIAAKGRGSQHERLPEGSGWGSELNREMKARVEKHTITIKGRRTSVSVESEFWAALKEIARQRRVAMNQLVRKIRCDSQYHSLSSGIRVFVLTHYRQAASSQMIGRA